MLGSLARQLKDARNLGPLFWLRHFHELVGSSEFTVPVRGAGRVRLRTRSSDASVFRQVFAERQYDLGPTVQGKVIDQAIKRCLAAGRCPVIIDAGANIGVSALFFSSTYPDATIIAVEPDPANADLCEGNVASRKNVKVLRAAVGATPGAVDLFNPKGEAWSVQTQRSTSGSSQVLTIEQILATVPDAEPIIVKVDIEGFEDDLFSANTDWIDRTTAVLIEPHDWLFPERKSSRHFQGEMGRRDFDILVSGENLIYVKSSS